MHATENVERDTTIVLIDDTVLPEPVSSFDHVARSTGSRLSLVPAKPRWPFGQRSRPQRQAG
jgi:hypothetical protein